MVVLQHFKIGGVTAGTLSQHKVQICLFMLLTSVYLNLSFKFGSESSPKIKELFGVDKQYT
jgi:hypothetical protein